MSDCTLAIIGLGYVGLPLAVEFGSKRTTIGFDINKKRIQELKLRDDRTLEVSLEELERARYLTFSDSPEDLKLANIYIVTVPTPVDDSNRPDLAPLFLKTLHANRSKTNEIHTHVSTKSIQQIKSPFMICKIFLLFLIRI